MPLQNNITKDVFEGLPEGVKGAYRVMPNGNYEIDLAVGLYLDTQDPAALRNALQRERDQNNVYKTQVQTLTDEKTAAETAAAEAEAKKSGDFETYKAQIDAQATAQRESFEAELKKRDAAAAAQLQMTHAQTLAAEISGDMSHLMAPVVNNRIKVTMVDGQPKVEIVDAFGNPQVGATLESLKQELLTDPRNAPIIAQTKASGSGASGSNSNSAVPDSDGKTYRDYSEGALMELKNSGPEGLAKFTELRKAEMALREQERNQVHSLPLGANPNTNMVQGGALGGQPAPSKGFIK